MNIGLLSDTHGYLDPQVFRYFEHCDEIWHAGDIGNREIIDDISEFKPFRGVYGNIDSPEISQILKENLLFNCRGLKVLITHIGGTPPRYTKRVNHLLQENSPDLFICGHSHILKIANDPSRDNMIYMNPGAAGRQGLHRMRTVIRFDIASNKIKNVEVIELGKRA